MVQLFIGWHGSMLRSSLLLLPRILLVHQFPLGLRVSHCLVVNQLVLRFLCIPRIALYRELLVRELTSEAIEHLLYLVNQVLFLRSHHRVGALV